MNEQKNFGQYLKTLAIIVGVIFLVAALFIGILGQNFMGFLMLLLIGFVAAILLFAFGTLLDHIIYQTEMQRAIMNSSVEFYSLIQEEILESKKADKK